MGQERDAFLWIRSRLEASANIAAADVYWGFNQKVPETKSFGILLDDGGRIDNQSILKSGSDTKFFTAVVKVRLVVKVPSGASNDDSALISGLAVESTDILDRWADIEDAIGAGAEAGVGTTGIPSSYRDHRFGDVAEQDLDESFPGWRVRESVIEIDLAETASELELEPEPELEPDLIVTSVWTEPTFPTEGQSYIIKAIVRNQGDAVANPTELGQYINCQFYIGDTDAGGEVELCTTIAAEETYTFTSSPLTAPSAGSYTIRVVADSQDNVDESDETNNEGTADITVQSESEPEVGVLFQSNWNTALGTSAEAISDGGKWTNDNGSGGFLQLPYVSSGGPGGDNFLNMVTIGGGGKPGNPYWCRWFSAGGDVFGDPDNLYLRVYFRVHQEWVDNLHPGTHWFTGANASHVDSKHYLIFSTNPTGELPGLNTGYTLRIENYGDAQFALNMEMESERWYRYEIYIQKVDENKERWYVKLDGVDITDQYKCIGQDQPGLYGKWLDDLYNSGWGFTNEYHANIHVETYDQETVNAGWDVAAIEVRDDRWPGPV